MVLPEGSNEPGRKRASTGRKALFLIAALVLAGGALALGNLTNPSTEAAEESEQTSTTRASRPQPPSVDLDTFTPDQIEVGDPLDWVRAVEFTDMHPVAVVEHEGWVYLFGSPAPYWVGGQANGLRAWRSESGSEWEDLGQVIPEDTSISGIVSSEYGLIAMSPGGLGETFSVWRSVDGVQWRETQGPPLQEGSGPILPLAVAATDRLIVVAGQETNNPAQMLMDRIEDELGVEVDLHRNGWSQAPDSDSVGIVIHGPVGLPIMTVDLEELGMSELEQQIVLGAHQGNQGDTSVWIRWDDSEWQHGTMDGADWVGALAVHPLGGFIATGWGSTGESGWTSFDGLEWGRLPLGPIPSTFERWGEVLVGPTHSSEVGLVVSDDGEEWSETPLYLSFPRPIGWGINTFAAGEAGLVASVDGWVDRSGTIRVPEPPTLTSGDIELTIDFEMGQVSAHRNDEEVLSFTTWSNVVPEHLRADPATETIYIDDPATGEQIAAFTFDELQAAEDDYWSERHLGDQLPFVAFSRDAEEWSIQSTETAFGPDLRIADLEVTGDGFIALMVPAANHFRPEAVGGFSVWSARAP
ncbi:MAG TPA: hypothetical protein VFS66_08725 [Acidimicrobiia bacterium]|nr:hypothetical protein [Acidimicrobiia bacterium]